MANRRSGGMGGGPRGRSFSQHQPFQGSGVSPWQGPNNSMNQGLLSNPQQLAMALTSLLQPQQQQQPPSLLSLNTSPAFSQNRDFGGRFGRGRDMRRHEPYNKNRQGNWKRGGDNKRNDRKDNKDFKKKDEKSEDKEKNEDKEVKEENEDGEKKESKDGPYHGIPTSYLHCFVCGKKMWDGESMNKHVKGRAHRQMLESLEESIHLTVNILREHMRLAEEKKVIEFARMQRSSKKFKHDKMPDLESHCNMCDLKFMGKIVAHRKNEGHQRLKRYLHPNCDICDKEFPSRMEWVEHRLTPEHLRKLHESVKDKEGGADGDVIIDEGEPDLEPILDESLQMEAEYPIFELTDDLTGLQNLIPAYKPDRAVSKDSLHPFSGYRCTLCNRSFEDEQLAHEHLATRRHYYAFIDAVKAKFKEEQGKKEKEEEETKKAEENGDSEMYDPEEACKENGKEDSTMESQEDDSALNTTADDSQEAEEDEDEVVEVKPETKTVGKKPVTSTPARQTRTTAAPAAAAGGVKNGAGPKSKKARK